MTRLGKSKKEADRSRRKCNIVLFNVAESTSDDVAERRDYDATSVIEVLRELDAPSTVSNLVRLGLKKDNASWPRPLRVTVSDEDTKWKILKNAKNDTVGGGEIQDHLPEEGHDTFGETAGLGVTEETKGQKRTGRERWREQKMNHIQREDSSSKAVSGDSSKTATNSILSCLYLNACSLTGKFDLFSAWVYRLAPDIIGVTETWATADIFDLELSLSGYDIFRQDRPVDRAGGGVIPYVKSELNATLYEPNEKLPEQVWCQLQTSRNDLVYIGVCYRPQITIFMEQ